MYAYIYILTHVVCLLWGPTSDFVAGVHVLWGSNCPATPRNLKRAVGKDTYIPVRWDFQKITL